MLTRRNDYLPYIMSVNTRYHEIVILWRNNSNNSQLIFNDTSTIWTTAINPRSQTVKRLFRIFAIWLKADFNNHNINQKEVLNLRMAIQIRSREVEKHPIGRYIHLLIVEWVVIRRDCELIEYFLQKNAQFSHSEP